MATQPCSLIFALVLLLAAGCTAPVYEPAPSRPRPVAPVQTPAPPSTGGLPETPAPQPGPPPPAPIPAPAPPPSSGATAALLQQSRQQASAGNLALATSSLERALRINPRDAELWLELGRIKLKQGDYAQAESMGQRGLAVAGGDFERRAQCEALIDAARRGG